MAASRIAILTLIWPVQRQIAPARASLISSSLGLVLTSNSAFAVMIRPGVQKPHCTAPYSRNADCTGCNSLPSSMPSIVAPTAANACTVCFGEAEGPMIDGARMGVFMLFGLTILVQGAFGAFFITLYRRSKGAARRESSKGKVSHP